MRTKTDHLSSALRYYKSGKIKLAEKYCTAALKETKVNAHAFHLMGVLKSKSGNQNESIKYLETAIRLDQKLIEARFNLGKAHRDLGNYLEASKHFRKVCEEWPSKPEAWIELGVVLGHLKNYRDSANAYEQATYFAKTNANLFLELGVMRLFSGNIEEAEKAIKISIKLDKSNTNSWINLAVVQENYGKINEAIKIYDNLLIKNPEHHEAAYRNALAKLSSGMLKKGWELYKKRSDWGQTITCHGQLDIPYWRGETTGKHALLVWTEQGLGDEILMGTIISDLVKKHKNIAIACSDKIVPLFSNAFPNQQILQRNQNSLPKNKTKDFKFQASLTELGSVFRTNMKSFKNSGNFLKINTVESNKLRKKYIKKHDNHPLIGISWRSANQKTHIQKSIPLMEWEHIVKEVPAKFVCLQYGETSDERHEFVKKTGIKLLFDHGVKPLENLESFAQQVQAMDLVISTTNTTVHIAGAIGKEVWNLVPLGTGRPWYWFANEERCLWYNSMKIYSQEKSGDWGIPLQRIKKDLTEWIKNWQNQAL